MGFCITTKLPAGTTGGWSTLPHAYIGLGVQKDASGYSLAPARMIGPAGIDLSKAGKESLQCLELVIGNNAGLKGNYTSVQTTIHYLQTDGNTNGNADLITAAEVTAAYGDEAPDVAQALNAYVGLATYVTTEPSSPAPPPSQHKRSGINVWNIVSFGAALVFLGLWIRGHHRKAITNARLDGGVATANKIDADIQDHKQTMGDLVNAIRGLAEKMPGQGIATANLLEALEKVDAKEIENAKQTLAELLKVVNEIRNMHANEPTQVFGRQVDSSPELLERFGKLEEAVKAAIGRSAPAPSVRFERLGRVAGALWSALAPPKRVGSLKPETLVGDPNSKPADFLGGRPPISVRASRFGEIATVVTPGIRPVFDQELQWDTKNEDRTLTVEGPDGKIYLLAIDGMGGQGNGEVAAQLFALAFRTEILVSVDSQKAWELGNAAIWRFNQALLQTKDVEASRREALALIADPTTVGPTGQDIQQPAGACVVVVTMIPPKKKGDPVRTSYEWGGDARAKHFRRNRKTGRREEIYSTFDQGYVHFLLKQGVIREGVAYAPGGAGQTGALATHPEAYRVMGGAGISEVINRWKTLQGAIRNPKNPRGFDDPPKGFEDGVPTKVGDLILLGSDGFWENFFSTKEILWIIEDCWTAAEAVRKLTQEAHLRMKTLAEARSKITNPDKTRVPFTYEGKMYIHQPVRDSTGKMIDYNMAPYKKGETLYLDNNGNVYLAETGGEPVNHFKSDNFSLGALVFNPQSPVFF